MKIFEKNFFKKSFEKQIDQKEKLTKNKKIRDFLKFFLIFYLANFFFVKGQNVKINDQIKVDSLNNNIKIEKTDDLKNKIFKKEINWGYEERKREDTKFIIIHNVYYPYNHKVRYDLEKILKLFKEYGVSSHYIIDRQGNIFQLVPDENVAYHAGLGSFKEIKNKNFNEFSIGIELINSKTDKITFSQYQSLKKLVLFLKQKYDIKEILGHKDIASKRKSDPWNFNLNKFLKDLKLEEDK